MAGTGRTILPKQKRENCTDRGTAQVVSADKVMLLVTRTGETPGPPITAMNATLLDITEDGFRIRYHDNCMRPGDKVVVSYNWGEVDAEVSWTSSSEEAFEAFLLVMW